MAAGEIIMTVVGNLTADPELRYTQNGKPVTNFTVANTPRVFDKTSNQWKDGEATFLRCSVWGEFAEYVSQSLVKGTRVIVQGRYKQRPYEDREGNKRTATELEVDAIGPDLRYAVAVVQKMTRNSGGGQQSGYAQQQEEAWATPPADEPWATPGAPAAAQAPQEPIGGNDAWATPGAYGDDTPF